jgi:hypothetical protein
MHRARTQPRNLRKPDACAAEAAGQGAQGEDGQQLTDCPCALTKYHFFTHHTDKIAHTNPHTPFIQIMLAIGSLVI